jgi:hypothetical protein
MGRKASTQSLTERRAKWNETRYARHKIYHQLYYLKQQYPQIFIDHKDELKQWLIEHNYKITDQFIELIRTFQQKRKLVESCPKVIPSMLTDLFTQTEISEILINV